MTLIVQVQSNAAANYIIYTRLQHVALPLVIIPLYIAYYKQVLCLLVFLKMTDADLNVWWSIPALLCADAGLNANCLLLQWPLHFCLKSDQWP